MERHWGWIVAGIVGVFLVVANWKNIMAWFSPNPGQNIPVSGITGAGTVEIQIPGMETEIAV